MRLIGLRGGKIFMECRICGKKPKLGETFYKTVIHPPYCDEAIICKECLSVLQKSKRWTKYNFKVEEVKS